MRAVNKQVILAATLLLAFTASGMSAALPADVQAKVDTRLGEMKALSTDANVVKAVKAANANPSAEAASMTNAKWKELSVLDPFVRSLGKNELANYLKSWKDAAVGEVFISAADGTKVAFLSKTSSWSHAAADKHKLPMSGKTWIGSIEVDESTGLQQVQVGLPVLDGGKPIGSIVIGLKTAELK